MANEPRKQKTHEEVIRDRLARAEARNQRRAPGSPFEEEPAEVKRYVQAYREDSRRGTISPPVSERNQAINADIRRAAGRGPEGGE
jgi:hypothetical protein